MSVRSGKSVSLEIKYWQALEDYRRKKGLPSLSRALEEILEKFFGGKK
jgi:hypothetical protein